MGRLEYTEGEEILKEINLVLDNESTAIIGQNGAGKSILRTAECNTIMLYIRSG